jgi:hypothetical protein
LRRCSHRAVTRDPHRVEQRLRPTSDAPHSHLRQRTCRMAASATVRRTACIRPSGIRLRCRLGLAPLDIGGTVRTPSGVCSATGSAAVRFERIGGFAPQIHRKLLSSRESSTCRCGVLWSGAQGHGRSSVRFACISNGQSEDRKTSWLIPVIPAGKRRRGRAQPIRLYGLQAVSP